MARHLNDPMPKLQRLLGLEEWTELNHAGFNYGLHLQREECTLIVRWPKKGSGLDDLVNGAIADGTIANAGIAPVVFPQVPGILARQISQASTAVLNLTGRKTPTYKARSAISRFNDSPLGITEAIREIVYQLRVYNRGAPIATVPILYPVEQWREWGMETIPFGDKNDTRYYLEVDWSRMGTPVPFLPSVFDLEPTGNNEWPYWYRVEMDGKEGWVLLHNSHIVQLIPSHSQMAGIGTSAVYMLCHILADHIIDVDTRVERKISALTDGILGISGVSHTGQEIRDEIEADNELQRTKGVLLSRGYTILATENNAINFDFFSFRQDDGVAYQDRREFYEDVLALAFEEFLGAVVTRGGIGYGVQADTNRASAADAGVEAMLRLIEVALGSIYPRVQVVLTRPNDAIKRENLENLATFAGAVSSLPEGTFTTEEIRTIINRDILDIPEVDTETVSTDADASDTADNDAGPGTADNEDERKRKDQEDDETDQEEAQLSIAIAASYLLAYLPFATVEEALRTPEYKALYELIYDGLLAQYQAADIDAIVAEIREEGIDPADPTSHELVAEIVSRHMPRIATTSDLPAIVDALVRFAQMGRQESEDQAEEGGAAGLTAAQSRKLDRQSREFLDNRKNELYIEATGDEPEDDHADIEDPTLPQTLDVYSDWQMASLIRAGMVEAGDDDEGGVANFVDEHTPGVVETRSEFIAEHEAGRAHGYGGITAGRELGALRKEWLLTMTPYPRQRPDHLATVGEIVKYDERFSNGDSWSQERPRCRCGIRLLFN